MTSHPSELFRPAEGLCYLDAATYGLAPTPTIEAMSEALAAWQAGSAEWKDDWDMVAERGREAFAELVEVPRSDVSLIPSASIGVGTVAASLTPADQVVVPDDEFTSVLFPLLVAEQHGAAVHQVPFGELADRIEPTTTLVATSLVQMQSGQTAALDALLDRAEEVGARVLIDGTQAFPFVGMDGIMQRADFVVAAGYKHLLCPRGASFFVVRSDRHDDLAPWNANWRAASDPYGRYFGGPLTLAAGAARFDVSMAWFPWIGAAVSLELLVEWHRNDLLDEPLTRARQLAEGLGVSWPGASIVSAPVSDLDAAAAALDDAQVKVSIRGDGVRLSTHVYTTAADVDRAVTVLAPFVAA